MLPFATTPPPRPAAHRRPPLRGRPGWIGGSPLPSGRRWGDAASLGQGRPLPSRGRGSTALGWWVLGGPWREGLCCRTGPERHHWLWAEGRAGPLSPSLGCPKPSGCVLGPSPSPNTPCPHLAAPSSSHFLRLWFDVRSSLLYHSCDK